jgi:hypothetical protein
MVGVGEEAGWARCEWDVPRAGHWRSPRAGHPVEPEFAYQP